jgi:phosphoglycolate phosphatase-like HAD superfamily hydrolase
VLVAYGYNRGRPAAEAGADAVVENIRQLVPVA